jgi:hypothetical protein
MPGKKLSVGLTVVLSLVVLTVLMTATRVAAQTETVLYNFTCCPLGSAIKSARVAAELCSNCRQ